MLALDRVDDCGLAVPHVFLVDPTDRLERLLGHQRLARSVSALFRRLLATGLSLLEAGDSRLEFVDDLDESFDTFWRQFPKRNVILRDMSRETLRWRYFRHPECRFRVAKLTSREGLSGYLIFDVDWDDRMCRIHDVLVKRPRDLRRMLILFARHLHAMGGLRTIRIVLADRHPYSRDLWKLGFVTRPAQAVFQVRSAEGAFDHRTWHLTSGDKDV